MSLSALRKLDEAGVTFRSHIDGSTHHMSPERSIEIQGLLGSDIQMQLDECVRLPADEPTIAKAMQLSLRWAERCRVAFGEQPGKALFGIVQGGDVPALRVESAQALVDLDLKGYAVGGLAVGEPQAVMLAMIETVEPHLPGGQAALPHGRRHAGRHPALGGARHRHVRLRDADPRRPARPRLYPARPDQPAQRPPRRGHAAARRGLVLPGGARLLPRLPPPPRAHRRDPGHDAADLEQPRPITRT